jgi:hypothetical protein
MKTNHPMATRRADRLPKTEAVKTAKVQKDAAVKAAAKQNRNDGVEGSRSVIPNTKGVNAAPKTSGSVNIKK